VSHGPNPWQQTQWDWRAAANFICGGAGSGLLVFSALSARTAHTPWLLLLGLALVGAGLFCVWMEIGRPLRALHVFFNPRTSWMTREGGVAMLLMPAGLAAAYGIAGFDWITGALALGFVYCQGRILRAAKGIPTWREPLIVPLIVATALAEGGGLWLLLQSPQAMQQAWLLLLLGAALLARAILWPLYRRRLDGRAAPRALSALDATRAAWLAGTYLPLASVVAVAFGSIGGLPAGALLGAAGVLAAAVGAWFKFTLITRAGFNQGYALVHLPVRGQRR
jgi:phenylacetyl-CoA:acceptor oxidoreductase subunit 2